MFRRVSITQAEYSQIHKLYPGCKLHNRKITIKFLIHKLNLERKEEKASSGDRAAYQY